MVDPKIENGVLLIDVTGGWGDEEWRQPYAHESVNALVQIIDRLQREVAELKAWHDRVVSG